jgi:predicted membrane-bound spermidine synthase
MKGSFGSFTRLLLDISGKMEIYQRDEDKPTERIVLSGQKSLMDYKGIISEGGGDSAAPL